MKNKIIVLFFISFGIASYAQNTLSNSKGKPYFSASLNTCIIWESSPFFVNPLIEYNYTQLGVYIGPIISAKMRSDLILDRGIPKSITIPGLIAGCSFTLFDSLINNKFSLNLYTNCGFSKYNYSGTSAFNWGGNWIDGPFHNTYSTLFLSVAPGLLYKVHKRFFVEFQIGSGIKYIVKKYDYISYKRNDHRYSGLFSIQLGLNYKFLNFLK